MAERIVVVGHSAVTCLGRDLDATWEGLIAGRSGVRRQPSLGPEVYLQDVAGMVEDFGPGSAAEDPAVAKLEVRSIHLAMAAARAAWADAGSAGTDFDPDRVAVAVGSAFGGVDLLHAEQVKAATRRSLAASPYLVPGLIINQAAGQIAQHLGLYGPSVAPANACASGAHAIALAGMLLRAGEADLALCGGDRERVHPADRQRLRHDEGPLRPPARRPGRRRPGAGQPAVQRRPGGVRPVGGGRDAGPGDRDGGPPARAAAAGRARSAGR